MKYINIKETYTFEKFIPDCSNEFVYTLIKSVTKKDGPAYYNPIFIHGPTGVGKTHLLKSARNYLQDRDKSVVYITAKQFCDDYVCHLQNKSMTQFRKKYRGCNFFLMDNIQELSYKKEIQKELFNILEVMNLSQKQIILASNIPPKSMNNIDEELISKFECGIVKSIKAAEFETKLAIINQNCVLEGIHLKNKIVDYIAENIGDDVRDIEKIISNLKALSYLSKEKITLKKVSNIIEENKELNIYLEEIIAIVSKDLRVAPIDIKLPNKSKKKFIAQKISIYLTRLLTSNSLCFIASYFGMKNRNSISKIISDINILIETKSQFKSKILQYKNKIKTRHNDVNNKNKLLYLK